MICKGASFFLSTKEQTNRQTNKQTNRHTTKQTNRHTHKPTDRQTDTHTHTHAGAAAGLNQSAEADQPSMLCDSWFTTSRLERLVPEHNTHTQPEQTHNRPKDNKTNKTQQRQTNNSSIVAARAPILTAMCHGGAAEVQCHGFADGLRGFFCLQRSKQTDKQTNRQTN